MAFSKLTSLLLFLSLLLAQASAAPGAISVYWGQNPTEGTLSKACRTGNYDYINIAFLAFGGGRPPALDLAGHCPAAAGGCAALARDIRACRRLGVKLLLSLGGTAAHSLDSAAEALHLADYIYKSFLGGKAFSRPLGGPALDGVDFAVAAGGLHWDVLASALANYSREGSRVYLTAAAGCAFPDKTLGKAIAAGVFDAVWVRFYGGAACQYSPENLSRMKLSWRRWNARAKAKKLFLGLPAGGAAAGYAPPANFTAQILPFAAGYPKYGGIMLWDRYSDSVNGYSDQVKCDVRGCSVNEDILPFK